jgi:probable F420-dependent oxidoreductase
MTEDVRWSVGLPQTLDAHGPQLLTEFAQQAERLGFAGLWTIDNAPGGPTARMPVLDGMHALTYVAAATARIGLGTAVTVLPRRHPVLLAKEFATIDRLSEGRLTVGVGLGRDDETLAPLGFPADRRVGRLVDGVAIMRSLWSDGRPDRLHGEDSGEPMRLEVVQRPGPPIWFGGASEPGLARAARHGDGWIGAGASSAADFASQARILREALVREGRDPAPFPCAKRVYIGVGSDKPSCLANMAPALDGLYATPGLTERFAVYGTVSECAAALAQLIDAGANALVLTPVHDHRRQLDALAEVVAAL